MSLYSSVEEGALKRVQRLIDSGDRVTARTMCKGLLEEHPTDGILLLLTARLLDALGESDEAESLFRRAAVSDRDWPQGYRHLLSWLLSKSRFQDVNNSADEALEVFTDDLVIRSLKFRAGGDVDDIRMGIETLRTLVARSEDPQELSDALNILSPFFQSFGDWIFVEGLLERLVELDAGNVENHRCLSFTSLYNDQKSPEEIFRIHRAFGELVEGSIHPRWPQFNNNRNPDRRIRVGYLSADFKSHVVSNFTLGWMKHQDSDAIESFLYIVNSPDSITDRFVDIADKHRFVAGMSPLAIAEKIKSDKIDILVDLAGHTTGSLTAMLAIRPAPIQVSYIGYASSSGLQRINYRIVDATSDPAGTDAWASESLYRLQRCFLCYERFTELPELDETIPEYPTAGSFNNLMKISDSTLRAWAKLHQMHPDVRLVAKCHLPAPEPYRIHKESHMRQVIDAAGGDPSRFELLPFFTDYNESQRAYRLLDVSLDPFPYSGTTSTFESLVMGVPVVTLPGDDHRSRVSASILTHLGLGEWVAKSADDYARIAIDLLNRRGISDLNRQALRQRVLNSETCNAQLHAASLEAAFRQMWQSWCENPI